MIIRLVCNPDYQNTALYASSRNIWNLRCQTAIEFAEWVYHIRMCAGPTVIVLNAEKAPSTTIEQDITFPMPPGVDRASHTGALKELTEESYGKVLGLFIPGNGWMAGTSCSSDVNVSNYVVTLTAITAEANDANAHAQAKKLTSDANLLHKSMEQIKETNNAKYSSLMELPKATSVGVCLSRGGGPAEVIPWDRPIWPRPVDGWAGGDGIFMKNVESWLVASSGDVGKSCEAKSVLGSISSIPKFMTGKQRWEVKQTKSESSSSDNWLLYDLGRSDKRPKRISSFMYATVDTMMAPRRMSLFHTDGTKEMTDIVQANKDKSCTWALAATWQGKIPFVSPTDGGELWCAPIGFDDGPRVARYWKLVIHNNYGHDNTALLATQFYGWESYDHKSSNIDEHSAPTTVKTSAPQRRKLKGVYDHMDTNRDGGVCFDEFAEYFTTEHPAAGKCIMAEEDGTITMEDVNTMLGEKDSSVGDNLISPGAGHDPNWKNNHAGQLRFDVCRYCLRSPEDHGDPTEKLKPVKDGGCKGMSFEEWYARTKEMECPKFDAEGKAINAYIGWDRDAKGQPKYAPMENNAIASIIIDNALFDFMQLGKAANNRWWLDPQYPDETQKAAKAERERKGQVGPTFVFADEDVWIHMSRLMHGVVWERMRAPEVILANEAPWEQAPKLIGKNLVIFCRPNKEHMERVMRCITQHAARWGNFFYYDILYVPGRLWMDKKEGIGSNNYWQLLEILWTNSPAYDRISHFDFNHGFAPIAHDLCSMELPSLLRDASLDSVDHLDWVASSLVQLEKDLGRAQNILAKGDLSCVTAQRIERERKSERIVGRRLSRIKSIVLLDLGVDDYISALMTPRSYMGQLDMMGNQNHKGLGRNQEFLEEIAEPDRFKGDDPSPIFKFDKRDPVYHTLCGLELSDAKDTCTKGLDEIEYIRAWIGVNANPSGRGDMEALNLENKPEQPKIINEEGEEEGVWYNKGRQPQWYLRFFKGKVRPDQGLQLLNPSQRSELVLHLNQRQKCYPYFCAHYKLMTKMLKDADDYDNGIKICAENGSDCVAEIAETHIQRGSQTIYCLSPNNMLLVEEMIMKGVFARDTDRMLEYILDEGILVQGRHKAAALLCLYSGTSYGFSRAELERVELQFTRYYGFNSSFLFRALREMKVLKERSGGIPFFGSPGWDGVSQTLDLLWPPGIDSREEYLEWRTSDNDATRLDDDPRIAPAVGRLVQWALQEVNGNPGWEVPQLASRIAQLRGECLIEKAKEDDVMLPPPPQSSPKYDQGEPCPVREGLNPEMQEFRDTVAYTTKRATIVALVGGSTWDQINAIRRATRRNAAPLMMVTTAIYTNESLIQSLGVDWREA